MLVYNVVIQGLSGLPGLVGRLPFRHTGCIWRLRVQRLACLVQRRMPPLLPPGRGGMLKLQRSGREYSL